MNPIVIWFAIGVACMAGELFTASFVVVFFGAGAWPPHWSPPFTRGLSRNWRPFCWYLWLLFFFCAARLVTVFRGNKADASATASGSGGAPEFVHTERLRK